MTRCIHLADILEAQADAIGDRPAMITGDAEFTYSELDERATRLANHLASRGVGAGDHVAVHSTNRIEWADAFYACFKLRAVPININYRYVASELRYLYENADCIGAIVAPEYEDVVDEAAPELRFKLVFGDEYDDALASASPQRAFGERSPHDRYLLYTGGTTGMPKGVEWRQEDIVRAALNGLRLGAPIESVEQLATEAAANENPLRLFTLAPLMHASGQWTMASAHVGGATLVLHTEKRFDARAVLDLVSRTGVQSLSVIGDAMARPIAEALASGDAPDLSGVFVIANGGAPLSAAVREQIRVALPNVMISDNYGSSETGTSGSRMDGGEGYASPRFNAGPNVTVLNDRFEVCGPGEIGMLARSGDIPLGYYKDPEKTAATFPVVDGKRWSLSGDFARIEDDGTIAVLGRGSVCINSGGEKIYPEEVEAALLKHEAVFDAAVVGTPSDRWGEQVTALVRLRDGARPNEEDLREHCRTHVADYKVPKRIMFVGEVPRTPAGKVDYVAAKQEARSSASEMKGVR